MAFQIWTFPTNLISFYSVENQLPNQHTEVLVRGWGENRNHYIYDFAQYEHKTACRRWVGRDHNTLWFEPIEWVPLPNNNSSEGNPE